ncbi:MAG: polysaccharide biosynthesis C-terminal domain-containing protein [Oscillospiraceae bacterium]|nr:polysaccharide biosynthesis C-terminal domain-containing protein [Oscillospiraceae bacterium]
MKKQNFLKGSLILIASAAAAKIMGAIFRIPLANMLGGTGMGFFSSAYGIFMTVYAVSVSGIPVAAARFTAEYAASSPEKIIGFRRTALKICICAGIFFTLLILLLAYPFSLYITHDPAAAFSAAAIAPSVFFGCVTAVYRGCFEGLRNMYPTAVSQTAEAVVKLAAGLLLCRAVLDLDSAEMAKAAEIIYRLFPYYYIKCISPEELRLPLAAAAAVSGVTLSSIAGTICVTAYNSNINKLYTKNELYPFPHKETAKAFAAAVLPIAAGALVTNLTSLIDLATITCSLEKAAESSPESFKAFITEEISAEALPNFFYGSFTGLAVTIFNLVPTFTNMFGKSAVPAAAECCRSGNMTALHENVMRVVFTAAYIAVPCGMGISAIAPHALELLFPSRPLETSICSAPLRILGMGIMFLSVSSVLFLILQGIGKGGIPVRIMLMGTAVKLIGNLLLIPNPALNISGAAISTVCCYCVIFIASVYETSVHTQCSLMKIYTLLLKLVFCGLLCGASAFLVSESLSARFSCLVTVPAAVITGAIIYILSTHLIGVLNKSTLKMLIC